MDVNIIENPNSKDPKRLRRLKQIWPDHKSYFLTLCVHERQSMLANAVINERIMRFVADSNKQYSVWVSGYIAMPDHLHLIVSFAHQSVRLGEWVKALKAIVARHEFKWQLGYFDHVLRSNESRSEKWEYIQMNPVRAGLVEKPEDWGYAGFFDKYSGEKQESVSLDAAEWAPGAPTGRIAPGGHPAYKMNGSVNAL